MAEHNETFVVSPDLRTTIIAACNEHLKYMWSDTDWRPCVLVDGKYFVKFGNVGDFESERATQDYLFQHMQQSQSEDTPRIAKILSHFTHKYYMYLVMEYIKLQEPPPDLDTRIPHALLWLSKVPLPEGQILGPVGGGRIRHKFFKDNEAPFLIPDVVVLDQYIQKAYNALHPRQRKIAAQFSVLGERVMFTQSDMDLSNFGVDEHGRTVLMDFCKVGVLPETFVASTLGGFESALDLLGLSDNTNGYSMAAIRASLWTSSDTKFGMNMEKRTVNKDVYLEYEDGRKILIKFD